MERVRKKDMLQTVDTLLRANDAIIKTASANPQGASEALAQCQESAILLGDHIETLGETHAGLVHILEDYCENIYQMSEELSDETACRKLAKKIRKQLIDLQHGIQYDLPEDKKEVVFLPYKASMWDSLESVWKAADEDPDCDAYVIPIPYFDKNPDGSFREEHYEGDQYPAYVPITRYDAYDLEARRPDVIYIHNPYDECNHVTSVHPYFYSKKLRIFTDKLVYIPYFVLAEIDPDDQAAIEGMKHFCFTPGTIYADQVIVQSEAMRQIYINEYMKAAKEMGLFGEHTDRRFLEKKFLGTGSPKIDKVMNTKKEDLEIPEEWLRIIEKPDGSWKKIIFYNTSVSALLQHNEKMLKKMESVFEIFKENKDEVVLLWRPHPLIRATIESMRPQLWEAYKELKGRYVEEGWGIYDDSADVDRAVVISDAYYGDPSSVVKLCQETGKPIMMQDVKEHEKQKEEQCSVYDLICIDRVYNDGKENIFIGKKLNYIFLLDINSGKVDAISRISNTAIDEYRAFSGCLKYNDKIICIPCYEKTIAIYHISNKEFNYVRIDTGNSERPVRIINAFVLNDYVYMVSYGMKSIIKFDLKKEIVLQYFPMDTLKNSDEIGWQNSLYNNYIYIPVVTKKTILAFSVIEEKYYEYELACKSEGFDTICCENDHLWLIGNSKEIIMWNIHGKNYKIFRDFPKDFKVYDFDYFVEDSQIRWHLYEDNGIQNKLLNGKNLFCWEARFDGKYLWILPTHSNSILYLDIKSNAIQMIEFEKEDDDKLIIGNLLSDGNKFSFISISDGRYIRIFSKSRKVIYCIDNRSMIYREEKIFMERELIEEIQREIFWKCGHPITETGQFDISLMCKLIWRNFV